MRYIIYILIVFISIGVKAQIRFPNGNPVQYSTGWFRQGYQMADSGTIIANRDTTWLAKYSGTIVFRPNNKQFYYFDSTLLRWFPFGINIDTTSLSNRINLKLNISDTTNKWWGMGKRWVDTVYRKNDSTIGFTVNNGVEQTIQILGRSQGGGGAGLTSVGLSMPSAFSVSGSPLTSNGVINVSGAGTTAQYMRGNGTLGTTDTGMIPNFHLKVRGLISGSSPITYNSVTGVIGIPSGNTTGTKGAVSFNGGSFSDNGAGLISLNQPVPSGPCTNCNITWGTDGRPTAYSNGSGGSGGGIDTIYRIEGNDSIFFIKNSITYSIKDSIGAGASFSINNIASGYRWAATPSGNIKSVYNSNTVLWDSSSNANGLTAKVDTSVIATQYDLTQVSINERRSGIYPGAYPVATVIYDTLGKATYGDAVRNNLGSYNDVPDTLAFGRPAAHFNRNLKQALTTIDNPSLRGGDHSMTWAAWVKLDTVAALPQTILSKDDNRTKRGSEYLMGWYPDYQSFVWQVEECCHAAPNDGTTWNVISSTGVPSANQWYFVVGQYDHVGGKVKIWVNMVKDSVTGVPNLSNSTLTPFAIGAVVDDYDTTGLPECCSFMNGTIKSVGYWKRVLDSTEILSLYNNTSIQLPPPGLNPGNMIDGPSFVSNVPTPLSAYVYSVDYDGVNDKTSMTNGVSFNTGGSSISLWFNADNFGGMVLGKSSSANAYIRVFNSTTIRVQTNITGTFKDYTVPTMSTGTWYNLIVTRDGSDLTHVYLNGTESSSGGQSQTDPLGIDEVGLYWDGSVPGLNFDGKISDLRMYNSLLSGSDITAIQTNSATSASPFLWYKLNEGTGVVNFDYGTAPTPHPLEYSELPLAMQMESPNSFVSYWDLSEPYGQRYDARLRNIIRDSAVTNLLVDISRQNQYLYGSTSATGDLILKSTTNTSPATGATIKLLANANNYRALTVFNSGKVSIGDSIENDNLSILAPTTSNAISLGGRRNDGLKLWGLSSDGSANTTLEAANGMSITSGNSNTIAIIPATGVTVGTNRSTTYKFDVLEDRPNRVDTTISGYFSMTGSTYNTTGDSSLAIAVYALADGTRVTGSNPQRNIALYGRAENGQENYALKLDGGLFRFNGVSGPPSTYNVLVHGLTDSNVYQIPISAISGVNIYNSNGTLPEDRNVFSGGFTLRFSGVNNSDTLVSIVNSGTSSTGLYSIGSLFGIDAQSTNVGVRAFGTSTGLLATGQNSEGAVLASNTIRGAKISSTPSSTNTIQEVLRLDRSSTGTPANGIGGSIDLIAEDASSNASTTNQIVWKWTDATSATRTSQLYITGVNNASSSTLLTLDGDGALRLDQYGSGSFTGTPVFTLQSTSSGNIIEGPLVSSGTWSPTLTNGANSSGASLGAARYSRIGNIVTFAFTFTTTTSAGATATSVSATLPIASNFTVGNQASGTNCGLTGNVVADFSNDVLSINWVSGTGGSESITVVGQYIIL